MSCFIMQPEAIGAIAHTTANLLNSGLNYFGFDAPLSLYKALRGCEDGYGFFNEGLIYHELYQLNAAAHAGRYKEPIETSVPDIDLEGCAIAEYREYNNHYIIKNWHYKLAKLLDCYCYQIDEDATRQHPLALSMHELTECLFKFIVRNTEEYNQTPWGKVG